MAFLLAQTVIFIFSELYLWLLAVILTFLFSVSRSNEEARSLLFLT